jgi:hypothetical protein|tara:strand:- start:227 stop:607 length:381 start_codon:yes stop_codon:yes gene_type:complete
MSNYVGCFDISNITLKDVLEVQNILKEEGRLRAVNDPANPTPKLKSDSYIYRMFIEEILRLKIIEELNETYFGKRIPLTLNKEKEKQELPIAELVDCEPVEYEPLFPILDPNADQSFGEKGLIPSE